MKNYVKLGDSLKFIADGTYKSGDGVVLTDRAGIACHDAVSGEWLEVRIEGVVRYAKAAVALTVGQKVYYNESNDNVSSSSSGAKAMGWAASLQTSGSTECEVKLGAF